MIERATPTLVSWRIWVPAAAVAAAIFIVATAPGLGQRLAPWGVGGAVVWGWYSFKQWRQVFAFVAVITSFGAATLFFGRLIGSAAVLPVLAGICAGIVLAEGLVQRRGMSATPVGSVVSEAALPVFPLALFFWLSSLLGFGLGFLMPFGWMLAAAASVTFFLSWPLLGGRRGTAAALVAALIVAETLWVVSFWPVGALAGGAVAAAGATAAVALARDGIAGRLNAGRVVAVVALAALSVGIVIGVSRWFVRP